MHEQGTATFACMVATPTAAMTCLPVCTQMDMWGPELHLGICLQKGLGLVLNVGNVSLWVRRHTRSWLACCISLSCAIAAMRMQIHCCHYKLAFQPVRMQENKRRRSGIHAPHVPGESNHAEYMHGLDYRQRTPGKNSNWNSMSPCCVLILFVIVVYHVCRSAEDSQDAMSQVEFRLPAEALVPLPGSAPAPRPRPTAPAAAASSDPFDAFGSPPATAAAAARDDFAELEAIGASKGQAVAGTCSAIISLTRVREWGELRRATCKHPTPSCTSPPPHIP